MNLEIFEDKLKNFPNLILQGRKKLVFCNTKLWTSPLTAFVKSIA